MTEQKARRLAKKRLSAKRYQHTLNVRRMAVKLAKRWGADPEKAALAAFCTTPQKSCRGRKCCRY